MSNKQNLNECQVKSQRSISIKGKFILLKCKKTPLGQECNDNSKNKRLL